MTTRAKKGHLIRGMTAYIKNNHEKFRKKYLPKISKKDPP